MRCEDEHETRVLRDASRPEANKREGELRRVGARLAVFGTPFFYAYY